MDLWIQLGELHLDDRDLGIGEPELPLKALSGILDRPPPLADDPSGSHGEEVYLGSERRLREGDSPVAGLHVLVG